MFDFNVTVRSEDIYNLTLLLDDCKRDLEFCLRLMHSLEADDVKHFLIRAYASLQEHANGCEVFAEILEEELMK